MNIFLLSLFIIVAGGCLPLLTCRFFHFTKFIYTASTTSGCILGLYAVLTPDIRPGAIALTWLHSFTLSLSFDSLTFFFLVPIFFICALAALYSFHYFTNEEQWLRTAVSYFFTNLLIVSMVLVTAADNMLTFALVWELMSVSSYCLVLYNYEKATTRSAAYLYFLFAQAGALLIFAAFAVIYSHTGSLDFTGASALPESLKLIAFFLAFLGFGSKAGVFPIHIWLPHAHPAAPSHISAIMSGVMIKMGIYGILRCYFILAPANLIVGQSVLIFGMVSGVLGVLYALGKHDIKRLLAYHSVENIGIILMGAGLGMIGLVMGNSIIAAFGFAGALLHVLNHSIFKSLLFMGAGAIIQQAGSSHVDGLGGLMKRMPMTGRSFLVGSVSISGLPPFNGFISEFLIYFAAFQALASSSGNTTVLLAVLTILSLAVIGGLASFCFTKVVGIVFLGEPRTKTVAGATESGWLMTMPMVLLAFCCLFIGLFPQTFVSMAYDSLRDLSLPLGQAAPQIALIGGNLATGSRLLLILFLIVLLTRSLLYRNKEITTSTTWGCGFTQPTARMQYTGTSYARSVVSFFRPFVGIEETSIRLVKIFPGSTSFTNTVSDIAENGLEHGFALPLVRLFKKFRWIQHGNIQLYIGYIILTILVVLLALFI